MWGAEVKMTIKQNCIPLESPKEWRDALNGIKHTFGHTWENCYAMHLTTGLNTYLYYFEKDNVRIVCPISERKHGQYVDIVKPFGFSGFVGNGNCSEFSRYWKEFVMERKYVCGYLGINPIYGDSIYYDKDGIYQYDTIYVLDLTQTIEDLYANLPKNRKWMLKKWADISSRFVLEKSVLKDFFLETYIDFMRKKDASAFYFLSKETLAFLLDLDNIILVGAQISGQIVAVSVFNYTPDMGEYMFSISLPEGRNQSTALVWYGVNHLKSLLIPAINLGGGGGGTADFKRRFGSKELPLRCSKQIYRPEIYETLCRQINADPIDKTGFFPAYRKPEFELHNEKVRLG